MYTECHNIKYTVHERTFFIILFFCKVTRYVFTQLVHTSWFFVSFGKHCFCLCIYATLRYPNFIPFFSLYFVVSCCLAWLSCCFFLFLLSTSRCDRYVRLCCDNVFFHNYTQQQQNCCCYCYCLFQMNFVFFGTGYWKGIKRVMILILRSIEIITEAVFDFIFLENVFFEHSRFIVSLMFKIQI